MSPCTTITTISGEWGRVANYKDLLDSTPHAQLASKCGYNLT